MAEAQLQQFLEKVRQLNAFVALSEADPLLRQELRDCSHHDQVVALARRCGFEIGRRWGEGGAAVPAAPFPSSGGGRGPGEPLFQPLPRAGEPCGEDRPEAAALAAPIATPAGGSPQGPAGLPNPPLLPSPQTRALLSGPCPAPGEERTTVLLATRRWRLERIHSCLAVSPAGFWYDQPEHEWLLLLQGSARLRFADEPRDRALRVGDSLWIAPHRRHRVTATDGPPGTLWLALFWPAD